MRKKGKRVNLSHSFWNGYKQFLKGEKHLSELKKNFEFPSDIVFFKEECNRECNILRELEKLELKKFNTFIQTLLLTIENLPNPAKKATCKKILVIFLGNYACFATGKSKERTKDVMFHLALSIGEVPENEILNQRGLEMMYLLVSSRNLVKNKEAFIRPIIFKLICLYAALAVSDMEGRMKCQDLGRLLSFKWSKSTPESVTLSCLKKKERNSTLPINECELLEKYSF